MGKLKEPPFLESFDPNKSENWREWIRDIQVMVNERLPKGETLTPGNAITVDEDDNLIDAGGVAPEDSVSEEYVQEYVQTYTGERYITENLLPEAGTEHGARFGSYRIGLLTDDDYAFFDETGNLLFYGTTNITIAELTATRLISTSAAKEMASVTDLTDWIAGGSGVSVVDDTDGTVTVQLGALTVNTHTTSQVLTISDLFEIHVFNSASDLTCTLPSVSGSNLGSWVVIVRIGAGKVTIEAADADTVLDGTSIECDDAVYDNCAFTPVLITATEWGAGQINFGIWSTR